MSDVLLTVGGDASALNNAIDAALSKPRSLRGINANSFTEPLGRITGKASEFSKSMEASNARVLAFGASAGAIYAVHKSFETLLSSTIEVQKSMNLLGTLFNVSNTTLKNFTNSLFEVANLTGQTFKSATEAANTFARQGLSAAETLKRTQDALILARIAGMDFADSARVITTAINSFNKEALSSTEIINALSAAETHFSVNSSDLAEAISRVGTSAENANVTLDETISLVTAAAQITGRSGSVIGNSFKSIFTRLERPKVLEDLEQIGVATRDASGNILPMIDVLKNLASTYNMLTPSQQSFIAEAVGGVYQINTLKAVLGDLGSGFSVYDRVLKTVTNSTSSVIDRNNQLNETISAKLNQTLNNFIQTASKVGDLVIAPSLGKGADLGSNLLKSFSDTLDADSIGGEIARGLLKGIGGVLSGPGVQFLTFAMLKLFQNLTTFAGKSIGEFTGIQTKAKELELTQVQVLQKLTEQPKILEAIKNGTMTVDQAAKDVFKNIQAQNTALEAQLGLAKLISKAGIGVGLSVQGTKFKVSGGFIPNFNSDFAMEEAQAKAFGAKNPRAHYGKGTIGGRSFVMNSEETEIPNFGKNGDSAVIPSYSKGFVPNFDSSGIIRRPASIIANNRSFSSILNYADPKDVFTANYNVITLPYTNAEVSKLAKIHNLTKGREAELLAKDRIGKGVIDYNQTESSTFPFDLGFKGALMEVRARANIRGTALLAKAARYIAQYGGGFKNVKKDGKYQLEELGNFNLVALADSNLPNDLQKAAGYIPNFAMAELYNEPFRQNIRGKARPVPASQIAERFREYELALLNGGLQKFGFADVEDLNAIFGSSSRADFFARKGNTPYLVDAKAGYNDAKISNISIKEESFSKALMEPQYTNWLRGKGIADFNEIKTAIVFGNMSALQGKTLKKLNRLAAGGFVPNFAPQGNIFDFDGTLGMVPPYPVKTPDGQTRKIVHADTYHGWSASMMLPTPLAKRVMGRKEPITVLTARGPDSIPYIEEWLKSHGIAFEKVIATGHSNYPAGVEGTPMKKAYELNKMDARGKKFYEDDPRNLNVAYKKAGIKRRLVDFGNEGIGQIAGGFFPNFADVLSFKKSFDKEFGITRLTGILGKNIVGDLEYSGKGTKEIEMFDIGEDYRGKGFAKQFYQAMGKGAVKGTMLPQFDKAGNAFFPQLSRARAAKMAQIIQYGAMEDVSKLSMSQFENLVSAHKSDKNFWKNNSFDLYTKHSGGYIPNFAVSQNAIDAMKRMAAYAGNDPTLRAQAEVARLKLAQSTSLNPTDKAYLLTNKESILAGMGRGLAQDFTIDALMLGDLAYATRSGLPMSVAQVLAQIVKKTGGKEALRSLLRGHAFAGGFVPNFSALGDAEKREMSAGYSASQIRIGTDSSLVSSSNPAGVGVYNSTEGSLSNGISLARRAGINPKTKGMASGFVPNFADVGTSMILGMTQFAFILPQIKDALSKLKPNAEKVAEALNKASTKIEVESKKRESAEKSKLEAEKAITDAKTNIANKQSQIKMFGGGDLSKGLSDPRTQPIVNQLKIEANNYAAALKTARAAQEQEIQAANSLAAAERAEAKISAMQAKIKASEKLGAISAKGQLGAMIGQMTLPIAGQLTSDADVGKGLENFGNSLGTAAQVGMTFSALGPEVGIIAGGLVAVYGGLDALQKTFYGFSEELKKQTEAKLTGIDKMDAAATGLAQALNNYNQVLGDSKATTEQTIKASKKYYEALGQFKASGASKEDIAKVTGAANAQERQSAIQDILEKNAAEKARLTTVKNTADFAEERNMNREHGNLLATLGGGLVGGALGMMVAGGPGAVAGAAAGVAAGKALSQDFTSIFDEKFASKGGGANLLKEMTQEAIASGDIKKYVESMKEKLNLSDQEAVTLSQNAQLTKKYADAQEKLGELIDSQLGGLRAQQKAQEAYVQSLKMVQDSLRKFKGDSFLRQMDMISEKIRSGAKANSADFEIRAAKSLSLTKGGAGSSSGIIMNADTRAITEAKNSMAGIGVEMQNSFDNVQADFVKGLTDSMKEGVGGMRSTQGEMAGAATGSTDIYNKTGEALFDAVQTVNKKGLLSGGGETAVSALRKELSDRANQALLKGDTGTASSLYQASAGLNAAKVQELIEKRRQALQEKSVESLTKIATTLMQSKDKLQEIINQRVLAAGGGIGAFTEDFGASYRRDLRLNIAQMNSKNPEVAAKGAIEFAKKAKNDLMGFGEGSPQFDAAKQKAIAGVESSLRRTNQIYARAGYGSLSDQQIKERAASQVEEAIGGQSTEELLKAQNDIGKQALEALQAINEKTGQNMTLLQLLSGQGIKQFQNQANTTNDNQANTAMANAASELSTVSTNLQIASKQLENIKAIITGRIEILQKDTAEGKRVAKLETLLQEIATKLGVKVENANTAAPNKT
jgi:TP901 family phage tail tape measure protein